MPQKAQKPEGTGQLARTMPDCCVAVETVTVTPGMPETGTTVPEATKVNTEPSVLQLTEPFLGRALVALTVVTKPTQVQRWRPDYRPRA